MNTLNDHQQALLQQLLHSGTARSDLEMILTAFPAQEWDQMLQNQRRVIRTGANVVLVNGSGKKRKFNGYQAHVIEYPQSGSWMTVQIRSEDTSSVVKWRKQGYVRAADSLRFEDLNDDALAHIFGYFDHGIVDENDPTNSRDRLLWARDAARLHTLIASISHKLRRFANENLVRVVGHLDANFDGLRDKCVIPCIRWLCRFKLRLGRVKIRYQLADVPLVCWMLSECDTDRLLYVQAFDTHRDCFSLNDSVCVQNSCLIREGWKSRSGNPREAEIVDLTRNAHYLGIADMARALDIPFRATATRKELFDSIAENSPNVSHLLLDVQIPCDPSCRESWKRRQYSNALFSMPSVRHLQLSLSFCVSDTGTTAIPYEVQVDSCVINSFIGGLSGLEELEIDFGGLFPYRLSRWRLHIESATLRSLNVVRMFKWTWVSCVCPNLEHFRCRGGMYGNGTLPNFSTFEQLLACDGDVFLAGTVEMIGLEVPGACECVLQGFDSEHFSDFQDYQRMLSVVRSARFWMETE